MTTPTVMTTPVELSQLIGELVDDQLTDTSRQRLVDLLRGDASARAYYLDYMELHSRLLGKHDQSGLGDSMPVEAEGEEESEFRGQEPESAIHPSSFIPHPSSIPPIVIDPSSTLHSPLFTLHSPVGSFVFSHLAAAVILGIGLLAGLAWRISLPPVNNDHVVAVPNAADSVKGATGSASAPAVARITALADCRWRQWSVVSGQWSVKDKSANPSIPVSLGDRFALSSGFMEITYDTGAKVLLEGPCTYEIESARGGFLAIGRLTALVEKGANSRLSTLDSRLFAVRTPTAIVTDLGTEFGVEVEESGATRSHVFQGKIELRSQERNSRGLTDPGEPPVDHVVQLIAGESASVKRGANNTVAITREPGQPNRFVRRMPSSLIPHPSSLAYRLTDLGTLGGRTSRALAIDATGQVVGEAATADGAAHAFLYSDGKMKDLGTLHGGNSSANGINAHGQIVGSSSDSQTGVCLAFVYSNGVMRNLGALGGATACAYAITDAGTIVGVSKNSAGVRRAFLYEQSVKMKDLGALGGPQASSVAWDINAAGQVTGYSEMRTGVVHAFLYDNVRGMRDIGAAKGVGSYGCRINDAGQTVGGCLLGDNRSCAFVYDNGHGMKTLSGRKSSAFGINKTGQIVGDTEVNDRGAAVAHAFLYSDGRMQDLNSFVDPSLGWTLTRAIVINDSGQIAGYGIAPDGNRRAFLLTPVKGKEERVEGLELTTEN